MSVQWIKDQMKARGLKQYELGELVGLDAVKMNNILTGRRNITADEMDRIRKVFGYLVPGDREPEVARIHDLLARLDERQRRSLVLYLEALAGDAQTPPQAG